MKKSFTFIILCLFSVLCYAGPSGNILIGNMSTYPMVKDPTLEKIYRMNSWSLPKKLDVGEQITSYVEFNANILLNVFTDHAETTYTVECPNKQLEKITISAHVVKMDVPNFHYNVLPGYKVTVSSFNCVSAHIANVSNNAGEWSVPFEEDGTVRIYILNYPS
jgi:hypothetical protein